MSVILSTGADERPSTALIQFMCGVVGKTLTALAVLHKLGKLPDDDAFMQQRPASSTCPTQTHPLPPGVPASHMLSAPSHMTKVITHELYQAVHSLTL